VCDRSNPLHTGGRRWREGHRVYRSEKMFQKNASTTKNKNETEKRNTGDCKIYNSVAREKV